MNKLVKGAIATGVGIVLLMGGAGTLAYWNAGTNLGGATITAGNLTVAPVANGQWKNGASNITIGSFRTVPGDTLTYTQDVTLTATGDNLKFTVGLSGNALSLPATYTAPANATNSAALLAQMGASAVYSVSGTNIASTGSPDTYRVVTAGTTTITVTVTLTHAFQAGTVNNASQNGAVVLGNNALAFTQVP